MIYITSDLHFNHNKFFCYISRGFKSVEEMNNAIVKRWNAVITNEDDVYILGDLMLNDNDDGMELLESLNGRLHIIFGNHDTGTRQELYKGARNVVEICGYVTVIKYKKYVFYLSHYPTLTSNHDVDKPLKARVINLCGHTHTEDRFADMDKGLIYHCEMDAHNCEPVLIDDIIWDIKDWMLHNEEPAAAGNPTDESGIAELIPVPVIADTPPLEIKPKTLNVNFDFINGRCHKCVYTWPNCGDNDKFGGCKTYKRDPPDGGFYG